MSTGIFRIKKMGKYTKPAKNINKNKNLFIILAAILVLAVAAGSIITTQILNNQKDPVRAVEDQIVNVHQANQLSEEGVFLLDVRTVEEWQAGHIPGATLIPLGQLQDRSGELPGDEPILIYCRSGNRSLQALNYLKDIGFGDLYSMDGGINTWIAAGYDVEVGESFNQ